MTHFETVRVSTSADGRLAEVVLDRPELLNRFDRLAHHELTAVFRSFEQLPNVRAIVLRAEGKVFSAGGDFALMLEGNGDSAVRREMVDEGYRLVQALLDVHCPIVVALHGDAIGLGATIVLLCDIVVSHPTATIADPHVPIGLVAGDGGCIAWPVSAGMMLSKRYLLTGDPMSAFEAHRVGLVTELVDTAVDVLPATSALADRIARLPPLAVQGTKRSLNVVLRHRFDEVMAIGLAHELGTLESKDLREAISAFRERREPAYEGR